MGQPCIQHVSRSLQPHVPPASAGGWRDITYERRVLERAHYARYGRVVQIDRPRKLAESKRFLMMQKQPTRDATTPLRERVAKRAVDVYINRPAWHRAALCRQVPVDEDSGRAYEHTPVLACEGDARSAKRVSCLG
jgi:hypothetical protein